MESYETILLAAAGLAAGIVNTMAGGGSMLTVPALVVLVGLPGTVANGTNRLGVLLMNAAAVWQFRREGLSGIRTALPLLPPVAAGSLVGALAIARVDDGTFERLFGLVMLALVVPTLRPPKPRSDTTRPHGRAARFALFFAIGLFGGAFQAGVGILLVLALAHAGTDLVRANSAKVAITFAFTLFSFPVFVAEDQVRWIPGLIVGAGFAAGGALGARLAVAGGERVIRPVMVAAVLALAARMTGVYGG